MARTLRPGSEAELAAMIGDCARGGRRLAVAGGGSKAGIGAPATDADRLDMRGFDGVVDYDPAELVLTVRSGTRLAVVEALLAEQGQMLAFEPFDHGVLFGCGEPCATMGGIVAAGVAGPRRVSAGGVRDHLLGFVAVSGRGERFVGGAKVVKNVTGYDLPKLACGSWGRLFALTELTFKVLPRPLVVATVLVRGLTAGQALAAMAAAMGSQAGVAAAVHMAGDAVTAFRVEGFGPSVAARVQLLEGLLVGLVAGLRCEVLDGQAGAALWRQAAGVGLLAGQQTVWRVSVPPRGMQAVLAAVAGLEARMMIDWAGALLWIGCDADPQALRAAAAGVGGHAMLVRGAADMRAVVPALHPQPTMLAALEARVRRAFDPHGVFETGRFG